MRGSLSGSHWLECEVDGLTLQELLAEWVADPEMALPKWFGEAAPEGFEARPQQTIEVRATAEELGL